MKIACLSGKGGAGKTLTAVNLAAVAEQAVYIDCDVEEPNGHLFFQPGQVTSSQVGTLLPVFDAERCTGCKKCVQFCRFHALMYIKEKPMVFSEVCHSCGGLDIVAKIMNKYLHIELGRAMSLSGMCVALSSALVYDKKTVVLSILGTYFNGIVLDHFIFGQNLKRRVCIITKKEKELREFILHELHSGATIYEAIGAYNMEKRNEIITIVDKSEYQRLMNFMLHTDPDAFMTVYTVADMRYRPKL